MVNDIVRLAMQRAKIPAHKEQPGNKVNALHGTRHCSTPMHEHILQTHPFLTHPFSCIRDSWCVKQTSVRGRQSTGKAHHHYHRRYQRDQLYFPTNCSGISKRQHAIFNGDHSIQKAISYQTFWVISLTNFTSNFQLAGPVLAGAKKIIITGNF